MKKIFCVVALFLVFTAQEASATTLVHKSLEKCTLEANEIFEGKVNIYFFGRRKKVNERNTCLLFL